LLSIQRFQQERLSRTLDVSHFQSFNTCGEHLLPILINGLGEFVDQFDSSRNQFVSHTGQDCLGLGRHEWPLSHADQDFSRDLQSSALRSVDTRRLADFSNCRCGNGGVALRYGEFVWGLTFWRAQMSRSAELLIFIMIISLHRADVDLHCSSHNLQTKLCSASPMLPSLYRPSRTDFNRVIVSL
jgi:hypothetical protein